MQNSIVMAFRKRLKKHGYTDISIKKIKDSENYLVTVIEPLAHTVISVEYPLFGMYHLFKFK